MIPNHLELKYQSYREQGHLVLGITLSTYIRSVAYAHSDRTRQMFEHHFIGRVQRCLPFRAKNKIDYDWLMEMSPEGCWHYHAFLAVPAQYGKRLWQNGVLNPRLAANLRSFKSKGTQRPFKINSFLIEPVTSVVAWSTYITKATLIVNA